MDDLISRQAAIRWVKTECNPYGKPTLDFESGKKVIEHLEQMLSAQPEIIRCKDCRFQDKGRNESEYWNLCGYRPWLHVPTEDEHYCGYAERRTDEADYRKE